MDTGKKCDLFLRSERQKRVCSSNRKQILRSLLRLNTAAPERHQGQISGCDNGQNVWTHANGLWEQELSQNMRNGPDTERSFMWERKAPVLCVQRLQEGVWILSQSWHGLKRRTECGKTPGTPPLPLSKFPSTAQRVLSLYLSAQSLDVSLKLLCFFSLSTQLLPLSLLQTNSLRTLEISQQVLLTERERERNHMRLQMTAK